MKNEWIPHLGTEQPVNDGTVVEVEFRDGSVHTHEAELWNWQQCNHTDDIIAYRVISEVTGATQSDGSTASYYELPEGAKELQDLISYKDMNAQVGEAFRSLYRYGQSSHSTKLRDAKKVLYYMQAEIKRLEAIK